MRLSLILGLCIVLCGAIVAQADLIDVTYGATTYHGVLSYTRTHNTGSNSLVDTLEFYTHDLAAMGGGAEFNRLQVLEGTFTVLNGTMQLTQDTDFYPTYTWDRFADLTSAGLNPNVSKRFQGSYVNIARTDSTGVIWGENLVGPAYTATWLTGPVDDQTTWTLHGNHSTKLYGSWNTGSGMSDGTLLARLFVTTGANVNFVGSWGGDLGITPGAIAGGWGFSGSKNMCGSFTTAVPEPTVLALAGMGLVGLLCYAWRKRR